MNIFRVMALGLMLGLPGAVHAQDERLAQQALQCSVLMQSLAEAGVDAAQAPRWQRASVLMADVHRQAMASATLRSSREAMLAQLQGARGRQDAGLQEDVVVCGAWAEGFLAQGEPVRYVPVYPKVIAPAVRSAYAEVARQWLERR